MMQDQPDRPEPPKAVQQGDRGQRIRAFIGLPLPAELRGRIWSGARRLEAHLVGAGLDVKWIRKPENLHVTLKFLGQIDVSKLDALTAALERALVAVAPFEAAVAGFGAFPDPAEATVIWAGVVEDGSEGLAALARTVAGETSSGPAAGRFRAHVTVGRCKRPFDARPAFQAVDSQEFGAFTVEAVEVYESILAVPPTPGVAPAEGSTYVLRGRAGLRGPRRSRRQQPSPSGKPQGDENGDD